MDRKNHRRTFAQTWFTGAWTGAAVCLFLTAGACNQSATPAAGTGGATKTGGIPGTGGGNGGTSTTGGVSTGGARATGGVSTTGGQSLTGGSATGGVSGSGGTGGGPGSSGGSTTGGSVATGGTPSTGGAGGGSPSTGGVRVDAAPDAPAKDGPATGGTGGTGAPDGSAGTGGAVSTGGTTAKTGPCDIYQAGNTPCVAAHSTARALYGAYTGKLYQLRRADKSLKDIGVLTPGGYADVATQETFCAGTKCTISIIYDQSPQKNDLTMTSGGWIGTRAKEADAFGVKTTLNGNTVYGIHVPLSTDRTTGVGYRNNATKGIATGDQPESMYMVANGKLYSNECCFDYGNATVSSLNEGPGTMEAIYFGNCTAWGSGEGKGPWVMADLEEGLFSGKGAKLNAANKSLSVTYLTAMLKGKAGGFAIKTGDAQTGTLTTMYEGARPSPSGLGSYDPMKKQGGIVLGTGGDNSFMGAGDFFEGAMTTGYASDATDSEIQANIVAAGYGK